MVFFPFYISAISILTITEIFLSVQRTLLKLHWDNRHKYCISKLGHVAARDIKCQEEGGIHLFLKNVQMSNCLQTILIVSHFSMLPWLTKSSPCSSSVVVGFLK